MMEFDSGGNVIFKVNFYDMLDSLSDEQSLSLAESLSCQDAVIKHVTDQILEGCTENGFHGYVGGDVLPSSELELSRERVMSLGNRLLKDEIKRLRARLEDKNNHYESGWNAYHELFNRKC